MGKYIKVGDLVRSRWRTDYNEKEYGIIIQSRQTWGNAGPQYSRVFWGDERGFKKLNWEPNSRLELISEHVI
tara:strand:- start:553 stop:768 length:216 start_codon:yes stop_codon:yes gene_type:complete